MVVPILKLSKWVFSKTKSVSLTGMRLAPNIVAHAYTLSVALPVHPNCCLPSFLSTQILV